MSKRFNGPRIPSVNAEAKAESGEPKAEEVTSVTFIGSVDEVKQLAAADDDGMTSLRPGRIELMPPGMDIRLQANAVYLDIGHESEPEGYVSQHVEARLTPRQASALARFHAHAKRQGLKLRGGKLVEGNRAAVVQYLLEKIADRYDELDADQKAD